jgi:hypothetical protein
MFSYRLCGSHNIELMSTLANEAYHSELLNKVSSNEMFKEKVLEKRAVLLVW